MSANPKKAVLYRIVSDDHICPFGIKSKDLLERKGFEIEDHHFTSRAETEAFMKEQGVETTPQTFIDGDRIGGFDELADYFDEETGKQTGTTYQPVIAVFATTFLMALAASWAVAGTLAPVTALVWFVGLNMCMLAILKLRDLFSFTNQFITYDLVGMRWVRYAYIYPFAEALAGIGMIAGVLSPLFGAIAFVIGSISAVSVIKAVYIDKRELKCACVGGGSNVPLGAISLTENLMMVVMGALMVVGLV
ncbi:MauE/DoxX family redox-associated membrane protein [uncultured Cohaesibacter sp.]|uniref:MauE/DoxX family redox-associated membrane protein n=1 Tax=uncultured Cohaesibacter sp. TaxID=1002546 RepID=UPI0029C83D5F|nr:MauE/DoxX family redox-associated membrane protein [uncultured Cohaesibacter sp.]